MLLIWNSVYFLWIFFILFSLTCHSLCFQLSFNVITHILFLLLEDEWVPYLLFMKVLLVWLWMNLWPCVQKYLLGYSFNTYFFLIISDFLETFEFPCFMFHAVSVLQWWVLGFCCNLWIFVWSNQLGDEILLWEICKCQVVQCWRKIFLFFCCMVVIMETWLYSLRVMFFY